MSLHLTITCQHLPSPPLHALSLSSCIILSLLCWLNSCTFILKDLDPESLKFSTGEVIKLLSVCWHWFDLRRSTPSTSSGYPPMSAVSQVEVYFDQLLNIHLWSFCPDPTPTLLTCSSAGSIWCHNWCNDSTNYRLSSLLIWWRGICTLRYISS